MTGERNNSASVLVVVHDFALGGTERIAVRLANAWAARGRRVTLFCGAEVGPLRALVAPEVTVAAADPIVPRAPGTRRALGRAARAYLDRCPHDVVFVPGNYHWRIIPQLGASAKVVAQVSAALHKPQRRGVRQFLFARRMRDLLGQTAAVVTLSDAHAREARATLGSGRIQAIPLPALPDSPPPPKPLANGTPIVLGVGRLVPEKGFDLLIRAFAASANRQARLVIAGDGPERARLTALAARLGVADRVDLVGYVPDSRSWMDSARLFVLSSRHEGFPAVVIEALAAGRPVIATDCTPAAHTVGEAGGTVVPINDAPALTMALNRALASPPPDPEAVAAVAEAFRIGPVAEEYLNLFDAVAA